MTLLNLLGALTSIVTLALLFSGMGNFILIALVNSREIEPDVEEPLQ